MSTFKQKFAKAIGVTELLGSWNASLNQPSLASGVGKANTYYIVSVSGSTALDGISDWEAGDWVFFTGTQWEKIDNTEKIEVVDSMIGNETEQAPSVSSVKTYIDAGLAEKQAIVTGGASTITSTDLTASKALISDANGKVAVSSVTSTELGHLAGVTSAIQTQLDLKLDESGDQTFNGKLKIGPTAEITTPKLTVQSSQLAGTNTSAAVEVWSNGTGVSTLALLNGSPDASLTLIQRNANDLLFIMDAASKMRFSQAGHLYINATASANTVFSSTTTSGLTYQNASYFAVSRSAGVVEYLNRLTSDGTILEFRQDGVSQGTVSVSGTTVSYNAFAGSHWSQLTDNSKPEILRGTVIETIDEMCEWPNEAPTERLPKCKVSDTPASKKVYGVFMAWDDDWTETNDLYVTALGSFVCRIAANQTVQSGDLLESNGDGCARVQSDDLIRSSTIGKVTSTTVITTYEDGSYLVPVVLYCG